MPKVSDVAGIVLQYLAWSHRRPVEIAFFGGNFFGLPELLRTRYLQAVQPWIQSGQARGIRCSTRPDSMAPWILDAATGYGMRTVEIGAQSMDDRVLEVSKRGHGAAHTRDAVHLLRKQGIGVGIQLMVGLPFEDTASALNTAREVVALAPDFVRIYPTLVFPGTGLARLYRSGAYHPLLLEEAVARCAAMARILNAAGIRIIRMGLPAALDGSEEAAGVVGPQHPAFGHLVLSQIYRDAVLAAAEGRGAGPMAIRVHPKDRSRLHGQANATLRIVAQRFKAAPITVIPDPAMLRGTIQIDDFPPVTAWRADR